METIVGTKEEILNRFRHITYGVWANVEDTVAVGGSIHKQLDNCYPVGSLLLAKVVGYDDYDGCMIRSLPYTQPYRIISQEESDHLKQDNLTSIETLTQLSL